MSAVSFTTEAESDGARAGILRTPHGAVPTPAFMPVGTRATVKSIAIEDLETLGADIVLSNTYHLMLRPGADLVEEFGGLHGFMAWDRPILTDSGGYQIYSLSPSISEEGAVFRSTYDGGPVHLTPEDAVRIQQRLGPDIAMVLDVCLGLPAPQSEVREAMELTLRWAERSVAVHDRVDQALFGIVQGGVDPALRAESAALTARLGFHGFGIGGLSVGEEPHERNRALEASIVELPTDKPRYVMGLGDTEGLLDAVARGADLFDCVLPTRLARHGKVLAAVGNYNLKRTENRASQEPLESGCPCSTCRRHSRGYLRHLLNVGETTAARLLTIHNLAHTLRLMSEAREAIIAGDFAGFRRRRTGGLDGE